MQKRAHRLMSFIVLLLLAAVGIVTAESWQAVRRRSGAAVEFQELVGGLGFGGELDLSRCAHAMDPRIQSTCTAHLGPLLSGELCCVCHSFSSFFVESRDGAQITRWEGPDAGGD